jgi:cytochrome c-type biogenesis protein CcmF
VGREAGGGRGGRRWGAGGGRVRGAALPWVFYGYASLLTMVALAVGLWVCITSLWDPVRRLLRRDPAMPLTRAHWGVCMAHLGVGIFIIGATFVSAYDFEGDRAVSPGEQFQAQGYEFLFLGTRDVAGPNFDAVEGQFELRRGGRFLGTLRPQQRIYRVQTNPMTQTAIHAAPHRDILLSLGEPLGNGAWSLRVQVKPMVRFIWLGTLIMALGAILAMTDRRYRVPARAREPAPAAQPRPAGGG